MYSISLEPCMLMFWNFMFWFLMKKKVIRIFFLSQSSPILELFPFDKITLKSYICTVVTVMAKQCWNQTVLESGSWGHSVLQTPALVLKVIFCTQCGPRSDGSSRSSLIWVHTVCQYAKIGLKRLQEYSADDINRQHFQTQFFLVL